MFTSSSNENVFSPTSAMMVFQPRRQDPLRLCRCINFPKCFVGDVEPMVFSTAVVHEAHEFFTVSEVEFL